MYFPVKEITADPGSVGLDYEDILFKTSDNRLLNGWYIPSGKEDSTLLFCHGNAGNISHRLEKILLLHDLDLNIFIFDYRGYGKSEGKPSETGLYRDTKAAYSYLIEERGILEDKIILYGESIGGGVVIDLAQGVRVKALITEGAFTSLKDMAKATFPLIPQVMVGRQYDSLHKIRTISCPKLIIHSTDDEIVPFSMGERLFDAASPPKRLLKLNGPHNTAFLDSKEEFTKGIGSFLKEPF